MQTKFWLVIIYSLIMDLPFFIGFAESCHCFGVRFSFISRACIRLSTSDASSIFMADKTRE